MNNHIKNRSVLLKLNQKLLNHPGQPMEMEAQGMRFKLVFLGMSPDEAHLDVIERKMKQREGLNEKERKIAIKAGLIAKDEEWFWTPAWQTKEKEADKDIAAGRYKEFATVDDLLADLKKCYN